MTHRYRAVQACRLASGVRLMPGTEIDLTPAAAKYPLLRKWIVPVPPEPEPEPEPEPRPPKPRRGR